MNLFLRFAQIVDDRFKVLYLFWIVVKFKEESIFLLFKVFIQILTLHQMIPQFFILFLKMLQWKGYFFHLWLVNYFFFVEFTCHHKILFLQPTWLNNIYLCIFLLKHSLKLVIFILKIIYFSTSLIHLFLIIFLLLR